MANPNSYAYSTIFDRVQDSHEVQEFWMTRLDWVGIQIISLKCVIHMKTVYQDENSVVQVENSVEWKPCINKECKSLELTI